MSDPWDAIEAECCGCGMFGPVNDLGLCETCAGLELARISLNGI